jgi:transcription termination factor NusB
MKTISEIIENLDEIDDNIEEMHQIPSEKINLVRLKINEIVEILDDLSNEYGDEYIDDNDYNEDDDIEY